MAVAFAAIPGLQRIDGSRPSASEQQFYCRTFLCRAGSTCLSYLLYADDMKCYLHIFLHMYICLYMHIYFYICISIFCIYIHCLGTNVLSCLILLFDMFQPFLRCFLPMLKVRQMSPSVTQSGGSSHVSLWKIMTSKDSTDSFVISSYLNIIKFYNCYSLIYFCHTFFGWDWLILQVFPLLRFLSHWKHHRAIHLKPLADRCSSPLASSAGPGGPAGAGPNPPWRRSKRWPSLRTPRGKDTWTKIHGKTCLFVEYYKMYKYR